MLLEFMACILIEANFMVSISDCTIRDFWKGGGGGWKEALSMESMVGIGIFQILLLKCKRNILGLEQNKKH